LVTFLKGSLAILSAMHANSNGVEVFFPKSWRNKTNFFSYFVFLQIVGSPSPPLTLLRLASGLNGYCAVLSCSKGVCSMSKDITFPFEDGNSNNTTATATTTTAAAAITQEEEHF
jgi:hypothetical protein